MNNTKIIDTLKDEFFKLIFSYYKNISFAEDLWKEIIENYTAKNRFYHNLEHIFQMYNLFEKYKNQIIDKNAILFSIFYHDFYYFPNKQDNELQSAKKLKDSLGNILPKSLIDKSYNYIIATKYHSASENNLDKDLQFFLDFDMAILGSSPEDYKHYLQKIRQEYSEYSDIEFSKGRSIFIKNTLENQPIFKTDEIRKEFEKQAIINLS